MKIGKGRTAGPGDLKLAMARRRLSLGRLPTVRAMALAWRNGLGAVLVALIGFGLIKGRTDVGDLARPYGVIVGVLLVLAIAVGGTAAGLLLRAAHGSPDGQDADDLEGFPDPEVQAERLETESSLSALRAGRRMAVGCAGLLVAAVGVTWYGPAKDDSGVVVVTPGGERCGTVEKLADGVLTLKTDSGRVDVPMAEATGLRIVDSCTPKP
jgi:hypothetical protein